MTKSKVPALPHPDLLVGASVEYRFGTKNDHGVIATWVGGLDIWAAEAIVGKTQAGPFPMTNEELDSFISTGQQVAGLLDEITEDAGE